MSMSVNAFTLVVDQSTAALLLEAAECAVMLKPATTKVKYPHYSTGDGGRRRSKAVLRAILVSDRFALLGPVSLLAVGGIYRAVESG